MKAADWAPYDRRDLIVIHPNTLIRLVRYQKHMALVVSWHGHGISNQIHMIYIPGINMVSRPLVKSLAKP